MIWAVVAITVAVPVGAFLGLVIAAKMYDTAEDNLRQFNQNRRFVK